MQSNRRTSRARSVQPEQPPQNTAQSTNIILTNTTGVANGEGGTALATTTATTGASTTRRTRSRGTTPVAAPGPSTSTPAPVLATISERTAQPNEASNTTRQPRPKPPARPYNALDAPMPSFSSLQRQDRQDATTSAAPQLQQTTGPVLESSQPPPAFSQLGISFGSAPLGTSFAAAPLNTTSFQGPAFTTPRGKGTKPLTTPLSFISTLSSPTASGNFRDITTVPDPRTLPSNTTTTAPNNNNTTLPNILTAPRDSRAAIILDDESDIEELSNGEDSHVNEPYGNRKRRPGDRPGLVPVDKEMEFYQEVHAGGGSNASASGSRGRPLRLPEPLKMLGWGGESQVSGTPGDASGSGPRPGGTGGTARRGAIPQRGGRSQKLTRTSGPTLANLMGLPGIETSVSYGAAAAASSQTAPEGHPNTSAVHRERERSRGRAERVAGGNTSRGIRPGAAVESRGRDAGGLGPHRSSRRRPSPVGMSAHPYAFTGLTPSTNPTSSGNTNAHAASGNLPGNGNGNAGASLEGEAGPATQVWRRGLGVLRDIDDDNDDDDVPSRANRSPRRPHPHRRRGDNENPDGGHVGGDSVHGAAAADQPTDDEDTARQMAAARRKEKWRRERGERRAERLSGPGLGPATPLNLRRGASSGEDNDRTPTQASQVPAFAVAPAPVASTSQGVVSAPKSSDRTGLWKSAAKNIAGPSGARGSQAGAPLAAGNDVEDSANAGNRPVHTRTSTAASGSNQTVISRLDSAVSQVPALPGIPGSFEGLSGIGGQNELGVSQFEESLPAFRYNSRGTGPALSTIHDDDGDAEVGVSFDPYAPLAEPTESQMPPAAHSDIIYNTSGNPVARASGELLRSEPSEILDPLLQPLRYEITVPSAQPQQPAISGSGSLGASQSTSSSQGRRKVRFGSYDPADDLVSWDNPADPNHDRTGETTGPQLFNPELEELQRRANNVLHHDDYVGNLEFGKSRQTLLDGVVRPLREIRAASTSASPTRHAAPPPRAQTTSGPVLPTTTGPSIGDNPTNPVIIDGDSSTPGSPTPEELRIAARHYVRTVIRPDRERRRRGVASDDEAMQGLPAAQLPPIPLPYDDSSSDEDEVEDDAPPVATVLVPNSSGSALGDDNGGGGLVPGDNSRADLGEWHEEQLAEAELEDQMESLYPRREYVKKTPVAATPLGKLLTRKKVGTQASMSSLGDIADGDNISNLSKEYPPNQEGYMRRHRTNVSDADTEPSVYPSQPVRRFAAVTRLSEGDPLEDAIPENRPSNNISAYPQPDNLSISTENSVMRSQFFSSKLMAYNSDQAGLKPGDEGYNEPPEENYVKWARAEGFSDAASTGTDSSAVPVKSKAPVSHPFSNPFIRMPGTKDARMSEEETPRASGDSFVVIPDSQEPPSLLSQPPAPRDPSKSKSTKSTDPRRRPQPPVVDNGVHAYSQAGPSRSQPRRPSETPVSPPPSPSTKDRTAWQLSSAKPYVGSAELSMGPATPPKSSSAKAGQSSTTPALLVASPPPAGASSARSEAEAQIEAELIPETQFSEETSRASTSILRRYSPIIRYDPHLEKPSEESQEPSPRKPIVLVPGTASTSQVSSFFSREPSALTSHPSLAAGNDGANTDEEVLANIGGQNGADSFVELSGLVQEDSFGLSGIGGQNEYVAETQNEQTQNEQIEEPTPAAPIKSFELPDPNSTNVQTQLPSSGKRKRDAETTEAVQELADKPSPSKKARKAPVPPAPVPTETVEPIRRTRSSTARSSKVPTSRGPLTTPVPPPRLTDAGRSRKRTAVPRAPPRRNATLHSIIESSPLSPPPSPIPVHEATASPVRRSKTYVKGRTLVPNSSASTVEGGEVPGTSAEQAETQTSATQDPFKTLAKSIGKSKPGKRKPSAVSANPVPTKSSVVTRKQSTRKRARDESPENNPPTLADLSPPPSKKHRREASPSTAVENKVASRTGTPPVATPTASNHQNSEAHFVSSPHRACQRGGRVFAPWRDAYYTASVKDSWEKDAVTVCSVRFDDGTWSDIPLTSLYRCELREGDKVKVPGLKGKKLARDGYVSAVPLWEERYRASVRLATIPQEEVAIFDGKKIAVAADLVQKEWKDRNATTLEDIGLGEELIRVQEEKERKEAEAKAMGRTIPSAAFLGPPRWKDSPPPPPRDPSLPSRGRKRPPSATDNEVSATSHKRRRLAAPSTNDPSSKTPFANHLLIHALALNDDKGNPLEGDRRDAQKQTLIKNIQDLGGKVVNGFGELLQWGGTISDDRDRWVWEAGQIREVKDEPSAPTIRRKRGTGSTDSEPPKIFLVADGPNRTTKYLMALAAGIPCLDQGWVYDENVGPWHAYILPAGQSPGLGHSCSQWLDQSYSEHPRTLQALINEPGPVRKAFAAKSLLFLYPSKSGSDIEDGQVTKEYAYAALACLMGASRVEVAHDLDAAFFKLEEYDAIVNEDEHLPAALLKFSKSKKSRKVICTDISWVRDCLMTGMFVKHCEPQ